MTIADGEKALRKIARAAARDREMMRNALRLGDWHVHPDARAKTEAETARLGKIAAYAARALSTLPEDERARAQAIVEHISALQLLCEDRSRWLTKRRRRF